MAETIVRTEVLKISEQPDADGLEVDGPAAGTGANTETGEEAGAAEAEEAQSGADDVGVDATPGALTDPIVPGKTKLGVSMVLWCCIRPRPRQHPITPSPRVALDNITTFESLSVSLFDPVPG